MAGAGTTAPYWIPLLLGGLGAAGGALSAGAKGKLGGYTTDPNIAPRSSDLTSTLLGDYQQKLDQLTGIYAGRAAQPVAMPGAVVNPLPGFDMSRVGGFRVGPQAVDQALYRGELLGRPGHNIGKGPIGSYPSLSASGVPIPGFAGVPITPQPAPALPQAGQGQPEMMAALALLGVTQDPLGNLMSGGMFTGSRPYYSGNGDENGNENGNGSSGGGLSVGGTGGGSGGGASGDEGPERPLPRDRRGLPNIPSP